MSHEKKLLVDVFQAYFYRKDTDGNRQLVFMSENLTSGGVVTSQENTDVRNGQGNTLFAILGGNKDVTVNLTENVFSFEALKLNSAGKEVVDDHGTNTDVITSMKKYGAGKLGSKLEAGSGNLATNYKVIKLDKIPTNSKEISIEINGVPLENVTDNATVGNTLVDKAGKFCVAKDNTGAIFDGTTGAYIVLHNDDANKLAKQSIKILPYVHKASTKTTTLTIDCKQFAEGGELWLQTIEKDEKQRATAYVYFVFENAMPEGNFEINTVSEVQPNDMAVNMRILANENGDLYKIVREEIVQ